MSFHQRLHGIAIAGMAVSALLGIATMILFISVGWPASTGDYLKAFFFFEVVGFILFATLAVLAAARDTHPARSKGDIYDAH